MKETSEGMSDHEPATVAEIEAALRDLSSADLLRLGKYARWRMAGLGRQWRGTDHEDLMAEAMTATLSGRRKWNKQIDFLQHLAGVMRSISSHWAEKEKTGKEQPLPTATGRHRDERQEDEHLASNNPEPDVRAVARIKVEEIESLFMDDPEVGELIDGLRAELTGPEIQELLEISEKEYWTRMRRMRRTLERHELRGGTRV
jgi:DNA-directed RNA polymerase specialized sigma24 family protein